MSSEGFPGDRRVARDTSRQPPEAPEAEVGIIAESSSKIWGGGNGAPGPICHDWSPSPQPPQYSQTVSSKTVSSKTVSYASPHAGPSGSAEFLLGLGAGGWVLLGWTGLVLSGTTRNPARLVYGSAALVASLRGQQSHFATLPTKPCRCQGFSYNYVFNNGADG